MTTQPATLHTIRSPQRGASLVRLSLPAVALGLRLAATSYRSLRWLLESTPPALADRLSQARALATARHAARHVPAYRELLLERGLDPAGIGSLDELPETDKGSYIDRWSMADRCLGGRIPLRGTSIDESSGSTGTPYNWVRGPEERRHV
ncbi:MAG: phenylacetate--CoA ligase family protein, partial [Chloroflexota bacterium]